MEGRSSNPGNPLVRYGANHLWAVRTAIPAAVAAVITGQCSIRTRWTSRRAYEAWSWHYMSFTRGLLSDGTERVVTPILSKESRVNNVIRNHT